MLLTCVCICVGDVPGSGSDGQITGVYEYVLYSADDVTSTDSAGEGRVAPTLADTVPEWSSYTAGCGWHRHALLSPLPSARPVLPPRDSLWTARVLSAPDELGSPSSVIALFSSPSESPPLFQTSREACYFEGSVFPQPPLSRPQHLLCSLFASLTWTLPSRNRICILGSAFS